MGQSSCQQLHILAQSRESKYQQYSWETREKRSNGIFVVSNEWNNKERRFIIRVPVAIHTVWLSSCSDWPGKARTSILICVHWLDLQIFARASPAQTPPGRSLANSNRFRLSCDYCVGLTPLTEVCLSTQCWAPVMTSKQTDKADLAMRMQNCVKTFTGVKKSRSH